MRIERSFFGGPVGSSERFLKIETRTSSGRDCAPARSSPALDVGRKALNAGQNVLARRDEAKGRSPESRRGRVPGSGPGYFWRRVAGRLDGRVEGECSRGDRVRRLCGPPPLRRRRGLGRGLSEAEPEVGVAYSRVPRDGRQAEKCPRARTRRQGLTLFSPGPWGRVTRRSIGGTRRRDRCPR